MKVAIISSRSFECIDFAKLIPKQTTEIIYSVPHHLADSIIKYANTHHVFIIKSQNLDSQDGSRIKDFCESCDHIIAIWDGQPDMVKEVIDYAELIQKSISYFELYTLLCTRDLDEMGRITLPYAVREKVGNPKEYLLTIDGFRIVLNPVENKCVFCAKINDIRKFRIHGNYYHLCSRCLDNLKHLLIK